MTDEDAERLIRVDTALYSRVVRRYIIGEDIARNVHQSPTRYIIDFGLMNLEEASQFPLALQRVETLVRPVRETNNRESYRKYWWRFAEPRRGMRKALEPLDRFIVGTATGKRVFFAWSDIAVCPSNATNVFAFDDDYAMGVLCSSLHAEWARLRSSTLKGDIRYTPTTAFATFPWPMASAAQRENIAQAARALCERRSDLCVANAIGLTKLYNKLEDGAFQDLNALHKRLDEAVAQAYGWPKSIAQEPTETNPRLLELNQHIAAGEIEYRPFEYLDTED